MASERFVIKDLATFASQANASTTSYDQLVDSAAAVRDNTIEVAHSGYASAENVAYEATVAPVESETIKLLLPLLKEVGDKFESLRKKRTERDELPKVTQYIWENLRRICVVDNGTDADFLSVAIQIANTLEGRETSFTWAAGEGRGITLFGHGDNGYRFKCGMEKPARTREKAKVRTRPADLISIKVENLHETSENAGRFDEISEKIASLNTTQKMLLGIVFLDAFQNTHTWMGDRP